MQHGTGQALTDGGQKLAEAWSLLHPTTGTAQVIIDDRKLAKTQLLGPLCQCVLPLFAFQVIANLIGSGLSHET